MDRTQEAQSPDPGAPKMRVFIDGFFAGTLGLLNLSPAIGSAVIGHITNMQQIGASASNLQIELRELTDAQLEEYPAYDAEKVIA